MAWWGWILVVLGAWFALLALLVLALRWLSSGLRQADAAMERALYEGRRRGPRRLGRRAS